MNDVSPSEWICARTPKRGTMRDDILLPSLWMYLSNDIRKVRKNKYLRYYFNIKMRRDIEITNDVFQKRSKELKNIKIFISNKWNIGEKLCNIHHTMLHWILDSAMTDGEQKMEMCSYTRIKIHRTECRKEGLRN